MWITASAWFRTVTAPEAPPPPPAPPPTESDPAPLVEKLAGNAVQTVVFDTDAQLGAAVEYLRNEKAGAARMVSLERLRRLASAGANVVDVVGGVDGVHGVNGNGNGAYVDADINHPLSRSVNQPVHRSVHPTVANPNSLRAVRSLINTAAPDCAILADHFFAHFAIAADYAAAAEAARGIGAVISLSGGVICNGDGSVVAGESKKEAAGILQRKQQMEKLAADVSAFEGAHGAILAEKEQCVAARDEAKVALIEINEKISGSQRLQQEQQTAIRHYENEKQAISARVQAVAPEIGKLAAKILELAEAIAASEAEVAVIANSRTALDEQVEAAKGGVRAMEEERVALAEHLKNVELEVQGLTNRIANDKSDAAQFGSRRQAKIEERGQCLTEIGGLEDNLTRMSAELESAKGKRTALESARDAVREDYNGRLAEIETSRKEVKGINGELEEISNRHHDGELKQSRDEQERRRIRERMWEAYELDMEGLDQEGLAVLEEDDEAVAREIAMYKERIKHVGQVNMAALEDFETESARLAGLTEQRDDLQNAVNELEKAISKLDKEARAQFVATFDQVQKNFTEMFTTLFEGGEASITLEEGVDPLEAEIQINVRPAGKKMRGVQLLSGGERALTAISLLFALYLVKPSAYCILDELDAPLDDANIGRFVKVLRKFAERTQFIVITHNKGTMEAADLLYGVTQQESGVSTIVSVKFEDAENLRAA